MSDRLLYCTPTGRHPHPSYVLSMRALEMATKTFGDRGSVDFQFGVGPVQMARTELATHAMDGNCPERHRHTQGCQRIPYDYIVQHDDDLEVSPESPAGNPIDVWHGMMEADPTIGMIGAVYLRESPVIPNVTVEHPKHPGELCHIVYGLPSEPFECGAVGTGLFMARVSMLRELAEKETEDGSPPLFRFSYPQSEWGICARTGEDYDFCMRVRALGYKVIADPRFPTIHHKPSRPLMFEHGEWERSWQENTIAAANQTRDLRAAIGPRAIKLVRYGRYVVLDHTEQRARDGEALAKRRADKQAAKVGA